MLFYRRLKDFVNHNRVIHIHFVEFKLPRLGANGGDVFNIASGVFFQEIGVFRPPPRTGIIDFEIAKGQFPAVTVLFDEQANHLLGQIHHHVVVGIGLIQLHHRKFGVVPGTEAFIAEIAIDLKDFFHAADQQPFQK